jgi:signal peptidase II
MKKRPFILGIAIAAVILFTDQVSKEWLISLLHESGGPVELTGFFNLVMVWNRGVSFGMFAGADARILLVMLNFAISVGLMVWLWRAEGKLLPAALGLVIGGAIGNAIDRMRFGAVADFFDFHFLGYHWPAFNIADCAIVVGVILLLLHSFIDERQKKAQTA